MIKCRETAVNKYLQTLERCERCNKTNISYVVLNKYRSYGKQTRYNNLKQGRGKVYTDRRGNTRRQKCHTKEEEKKYKSLRTEIQRMCNIKCMVMPVVIGATGIVTKILKKKFGSQTRNTFSIFTTKHIYAWNITHNTESTAA